jgi:hypothetical protein
MALSKSEIALYAFITGKVLPKGTTRAAFRTAVNAALAVGSRAIGAAAPLAPPVSSVGAAPVALGAATGLGILASPEGQQLLAAAEQKGREDRIRFEQLLTDITEPRKRAAKRKVSKYSKAVKAGIAAVKASKFGGPKGQISNAKKVFSTVNKVASAVNKGKKVAKTGIRGVAARAIRRIL